jgi:hypothetical protein
MPPTTSRPIGFRPPGSSFGNQSRDGRGRIVELAVDPDLALVVDGADPVHFFGDVDADCDTHGGSPWLLRHPFVAGVALHSDRSQSLISGRKGKTKRGDLLSEPSRAASMKTIPASSPRRNPGMPGLRRQPLPKQRFNGRAA